MRFLFLFIFSFVVLNLNGQTAANSWAQLSKVTYKKVYDALLGIPVDQPIFSKDIKNLEGKLISLKGYIIPTDGYKSHKEFIFSAFPYSSCFFCGQAGPETVIEVLATDEIKYTSEPIVIEGILKLNASDINRLMFQLIQVRQMK